jgi:hypothetical protein
VKYQPPQRGHSSETAATITRLKDRIRLLEVVERLASVQMTYIQQLEAENDAMRADLLLWRDTTESMCSKAGIGFTTEDKP